MIQQIHIRDYAAIIAHAARLADLPEDDKVAVMAAAATHERVNLRFNMAPHCPLVQAGLFDPEVDDMRWSSPRGRFVDHFDSAIDEVLGHWPLHTVIEVVA